MPPMHLTVSHMASDRTRRSDSNKKIRFAALILSSEDRWFNPARSICLRSAFWNQRSRGLQSFPPQGISRAYLPLKYRSGSPLPVSPARISPIKIS